MSAQGAREYVYRVLVKHLKSEDDVKRVIDDIVNIILLVEKDIKEGKASLVDIYQIISWLGEILEHIVALSKESEQELIKDIIQYIIDLIIKHKIN